MPSPKDTVQAILCDGVRKIAPDAMIEVALERPRHPEHGDYATSVALQLAKVLGRKPREIAEDIVKSTRQEIAGAGACEPLQIAGAGFINIRLKQSSKTQIVRQILQAGASFGRVQAPAAPPVQVEFVSANPTGPLHVGHGRQAALGDALAALLESQGYQVTREFYYNDAGAQIRNLALSVQARAQGIEPGGAGWPVDGYAGDYIREIAEDFRAQGGKPQDDLSDLEAVRKFAVAFLRQEQDLDLRKFGVKFDVYTLESSMYAEGKVAAAVQGLVASGKTYEKDGALWLRTTDYGDDKDRVVRKSDGSYTYFVPDVAYHVSKWQRGFAKVINVQGTDHHSAVTRVRAGLQALDIGIPQGYPDYVLHSLVKVMRGGAEVKISKRAGSYVTVRDLIDWVGRDAARFFLVSRKADTEFVFDIDLALAKSEENPVYYVQYAHARVCSMLAQWGGDPAALPGAELGSLNSGKELDLAQRLSEFPEMLSAAAKELAPHAVAFYLRALAGEFHSYYNAERILVEDEALRVARLALCVAVRQTIANGLALLGVSAPEKM
ncbi:MAG: arginine--tRNA ligase [Betaproteobacteria bacterium]|nr:arginine--tRNA ligase [Betaproteobacteria bacterium]